MKQLVTTIAALMAFAAAASAAETTLTGKGVCAKCELGETKKCQTALQVTKGGATTTYYVGGKADKELHPQVCQGPKEGLSVTGTVSEKDGKKWITSK